MFTGWHSTNDSQARYSQNPPHRRGPTEPARADPPIKVATVSLRDRHDDSISPGLSAQAANDIVVTDSYGSSFDPLFGIGSTNERRVNAYHRSVFPTLTVSRASALAETTSNRKSQEPGALLNFVSPVVRVASNDSVQATTATDDAISQVTEARSRCWDPRIVPVALSQSGVTTVGYARGVCRA